MPEVDQPMSALRVWVDGSDRVVMRQGDLLIESDGQTVFDFWAEQSGGGELEAPARLLTASSDDLVDETELSFESDPSPAHDWFERGCELDGDSDTYTAAIDAYMHAIELDPEFADAHCNLGSLHFNRDRRVSARLCFERALEIQPHHVEANVNIAMVHEDEGRYESALSHYKAALRSDPLYVDAHVSLALLYEKLGLRRKARSHWQCYLRLDPDGAWCEVARSRLDD